MRKLLGILILLSGLAYGQTTNVVATKTVAPFWVIPSATMPIDLWTNTVLWMTAKSPTITNTLYSCYAKNCAGDGSQVFSNPRPARVYTNGVWYWSFDGTDDRIALGNRSTGTNMTIYVRTRPTEFANQDVMIYGVSVLRFGSATQLVGYPDKDSSGIYWDVVPTMNTNTFYDIVWTQTGTNAYMYLNGISQGYKGSAVSLPTTTNASYVGASGNTYNGNDMQACVVWNRVLTSNEVWGLSNPAGNK